MQCSLAAHWAQLLQSKNYVPTLHFLQQIRWQYEEASHVLVNSSSGSNIVAVIVACYDQTSSISQMRWTAFFSSLPFPSPKPCTIQSSNLVQYDAISGLWRLSCVRYDLVSAILYDINLGATTTTILSIRGVTIPIDLVSSATDSIRRRVVLFKPVTVRTSDPKSEFLCQSSYIAQNLQAPLKHLVHLGYLPHPHHHVSSLLSQPECSHRVPKAEASFTRGKATRL